MIPIVGAKPPAFSNGEHAGVVAGRHPVDLGVEDVAHELGVGAVDDQLQALLGEGVVDLGDLGVERQQSLAARLLGERDEQVDPPLDVERLGVDHALVQRGDLLHPVHADARQRHAAGAGDDEQQRRRVHERGRAGPVHHRAHQDAHDRDSDSYAGCGLHDPVIGRDYGNLHARFMRELRRQRVDDAVCAAGELATTRAPPRVLALVLAALHGAGEDLDAIRAHRLADALRRLRDDDLGAGGERDHRVGVTLDGDDQVGIQMEELELVPESVQGDHCQFLGR